QLGIRYDGRDFEIRINQQSNQARDQLAHALPIQLIDPKSYRLLDAGPQLRREFIDWGAFNSYENFLPAWRQFKTALKQRNALLKVKRPEHIEVWNKELVNYGTIVADLRSRYIQDLDDVFQAIIGQFLQLNAIEFSLYPGWQHDKGLLASLNDDLEKDLRYGFTHSGPHRCELTILADGLPAKDYVSRGQLKLLVLGLKLAQIKVLQQKNDNGGCLLIDDFTAELDASNRSKLLNYLGTIGFQVFITATELQEFGDIASYSNCKVFHVEQGQVKHDECFT
ncbi:MAG: DNA replication/repair protein RecF, partial [Gammaproteobacteria bacterium]